MERSNSPSQHIYKLYVEFEKRGMDTTSISQSIKQVTGTSGKSNVEVVMCWIEKMSDSKIDNPF